MIDSNAAKATALRMRKNIIELAYRAGSKGAHLSPSLSLVEILAVLFTQILRFDPQNPEWPSRDRFLLSKGHGALGCYAAMYEAKIITHEDLFSFETEGGYFPGQPSKHLSKGIEYSGGSLGMGLSYGVGIALSAKLNGAGFQTYVLMGDGELNEGSVWESVMFAKHRKLSNLTAIIDRNNMQSDGCCENIISYDIESVWRGFGWEVICCDGHSPESIAQAFSRNETDNPKVIIAKTVKGKGISFMEHAPEWHHNRLTEEQYVSAMKELSGGDV